jgi:hypothetical protein
VFITGTTMATPAKNSNLVYEIAFFHMYSLQRIANIPCQYCKHGVMKIILLILAVLPLINCGKSKNEIPLCISQRIEQIKAQPKWNPPAEVNEYTYQGKKVYLFTSDCCDQYIMLYDGSCNYLCAPSGGIRPLS